QTGTLQVEGKQQVHRMDLCADGRLLLAFTCGFEGGPGGEPLRTTAWELPTGKRLFQWEEPRGGGRYGRTAAASPDGKIVAVGEGVAVRLRDAATGKDLLPLRAPATYVLRGPFAFSPDGRRLAVPSSRPRQEGDRFYQDNYGVRVYDVS